MYGNKGGVGLGLMWHQTPLAFASVHMAAHEGAARQRNEDASQILGSLRLGGAHADLEWAAQALYAFVLGDLNYRVQMPYDEGVAAAKAGNYAALVAADELGREHAAGRVLKAFTEVGPIDFAPSYRYELGSREFSQKKNQTPSYTDRILFRSSVAKPTPEVLSYSAHHDVVTSDHSPLSASVVVSATIPQSFIRMDDSVQESIRMHVLAHRTGDCTVLVTDLKVTNLVLHGQADAVLGDGDAADNGRLSRTQSVSTVEHLKLFFKFVGELGMEGEVRTRDAPISQRTGDAAEEGCSTSRQATWADGDVPGLRPYALNARHVGEQALHLVLYQHDPNSMAGLASHVVGHASLALQTLVEAASRDEAYVPFTSSLTKRGQLRGEVSLQAALEWDDY